ncbi:TetR/AcrR family transcriptional regulator [Rhodococcus chondri]|uniref:TetR/AcrR family transcriptional regulator n=1 Tax=Rhodococcus chondri TaxID=3065941 RepID=A0ABU7JWY3_9NOCA|nr:TetR/AcrR family transcriptional regulator [Rhodococcus sp. CC-R104]MEE2034535.1 TetR/AcrR family transcriptional regulator [Rhodococcus sp. CC-R104]
MRSHGKILNATLGLIADAGFEGVSIAAVAHRAGVSRQTVYSIFGSREELVSQAMAGLAEEVLGNIRSRLNSVETAVEYVVEFIVAGRAVVRADPILTGLLHARTGNPLFDAGMMGRAKVVARQLLARVVDLDARLEPDLDDIAGIVIRLGLSVIVFDDDEVRDDDDLRRFLTRWLQPALACTS